MFILILMNTNTYSVGFEYIGPFNDKIAAYRACDKLNDERKYRANFRFVVQYMKGIEDVCDESE